MDRPDWKQMYKEALERPGVIGESLKLLEDPVTGRNVTRVVELVYIPQTDEIVERLKE